MNDRRDASHRQQPSLFDAVPVLVEPPKTEQAKQLQRVKGSIGDVIVEFFKSREVGELFYASDLHEFVAARASIAPASADRVMRSLRLDNVINYSLVSRSKSAYRVEATTEKGLVN